MKKITTRLLAAAIAAIGMAQSASADDPFVGEVRSFGFNFCPRGWAALDGQLLAISQNDALFSLLGTVYGGDGRTTFGLPDLRGRIPVHTGQGTGLSPRPLGQKGGTETETATLANMASHTHLPQGTLSAQLVGSSEPGTTNDPNGNFLPTGAVNIYASTAGTKQNMAPGVVSVDFSNEIIGGNGGGQAITNMAPSLVSNYCIALFGLYPSRN